VIYHSSPYTRFTPVLTGITNVSLLNISEVFRSSQGLDCLLSIDCDLEPEAGHSTG